MIPQMGHARGFLLPACYRLASFAALSLRWAAFGVLATFEPLVRLALTLLALAGFITCILFRFAVHVPHFPVGLMLSFSVAMATLSVLYGFVVEKLRP